MFRSHIDFFAVLAIAAGLAAASKIHAIPAPSFVDAIRIEAPAGALDCPVLSAVVARIGERIHSQIGAQIRANLDR